LSTHVEVVRRRATAAAYSSECSPRTWRWSAVRAGDAHPEAVLSTHVEVVRRAAENPPVGLRALHARGGGPEGRFESARGHLCSPRTWRWSGTARGFARHRLVLSTHVEVVRGGTRATGVKLGGLEARGGG